MMFQIIVGLEAEREWNEAVNWYEQRRPGLGVRFDSAIHNHLKLLAERPDRFRPASRLSRKIRVKGWPYFIFFVVNESHRQVQVIAIWHHRRDPDELHRRLQ